MNIRQAKISMMKELQTIFRAATRVRVAALTAMSLIAVVTAHSAERLPNIIYIMADDLGYGDLGCYGQKTVQTPNIDRMAAEGMRFTDHYAGHTVCRPSRLVLWTGQHVGHTGLTGNRDRSLTGLESTVAQRLKKAGYATGGVGKWALGNVNDPSEVDNPGHPNNNGFDYWFGYLNQGNAHNFYPPFLWENKKQIVQSGNVLMDDPQARGRVSSKKVTYSHDEMTDAAFKFVRQHKDDPFLLHIHWTIPHTNNEAGRVLGDGQEVPDYGIYAEEDWPNPEKGFAAMITRMDGDVGELFALLNELKIDEHTLVLFTSDNGAHEEGGHKHEYFDSNGALKGYKRSMHDGGIRVPMIARWPGKVAAGTVSDHPSAFWDFLPTACEIAGVEVEGSDAIDGISYLPTLLGKKDLQPEHEYLYWASSEGATAVGVRHGKWKLVQYRKAKKSKKKSASDEVQGDDWRLYDLTTDIGEENDLAEKYPRVVERILGMLKRDGLLGDSAAANSDQVVVALIGDSTVTDSAGWGKAFAGRFSDRVKVINYSAGGRSSKSWLDEGRLPAVVNAKPDYLLIQFGHNGQPGKGPARETDPATSYRDYLKIYIDKAREIGATPVVISPVTRRRFEDDGKLITTLKPWAEAAKAVAAETGTAFIDLHSLSFAYHEKVGAEASAEFAPKEGDFTHFNEKGAKVIAGMIVGELQKVDAEFVGLLR
jgi:uncharacterized sulfatase